MYVSKFVLTSTLKSSLKWIFLFALYPYIVMSVVYGGGASFTGLLFSYITIVPTLFFVKFARVLKEKSLDLNEYIADKMKEKLDDEKYSKTLVGLKITRRIVLFLMALFGLIVLMKIFNISSIISPSLNGFLIALLQLYYIFIVVARIKYEE